MGICSEKKNEFASAKNYFQKAKEMELRQCGRLGKEYNNIMRDVAKENNIIAVDIASTFDDISSSGGKYLFLDPDGDTIHPNEAGHRVIASQIYIALEKYHFKSF